MMLNHDIGLVLAEDATTLAVLQDRELSPAALAELKALDFPANLGMLPGDDASRMLFWAMRETVAMLPTNFDACLMNELAADFAAIYLTGAHGASPYESYWLSDDHLLCQDAMFDIRALYAKSGLVVPDWRKRPDDHLVFQLQFIAHLLNKAGNEDDWRWLADFLDYHLLRWLPSFAGRVADRCYTPFYATLALLTDAWCQQLRNLIEQHLGEARPTVKEIEEHLNSQRMAEISEVPIRFVPGAAGPSW